MQGLTFGLICVIVCSAVVFGDSLFISRNKTADRAAIATFANQHGLRIISVTRSYNYFRYWLEGISGAGRLYQMFVEDPEGNRIALRIGFDPLFSSGQLEVLEQKGSTLTLTAEPASSTRSRSAIDPPCWAWHERLLLFGAGAGVGGLIFGGTLHAWLSAPYRPVLPDPALGYTYLFTAKHGDVYGTYFEYLATTYGVWGSGIFGATCALIGHSLSVQKKLGYRQQILAALAVSLVLFAIWRVFFS